MAAEGRAVLFTAGGGVAADEDAPVPRLAFENLVANVEAWVVGSAYSSRAAAPPCQVFGRGWPALIRRSGQFKCVNTNYNKIDHAPFKLLMFHATLRDP